MSEMRQLPLEFTYRPCFGRENFMINKCNIEAVRLIDSWPDWPSFAACIYGRDGCGKTHLAHLFADEVANRSHYPYKIPFIKAEQLSLENVYDRFEQCRCLVVEDVTSDIDNEALFHLYNLYRNQGGFILFTSHEAPARLHFSLPDLQSRMNAIPSVEIQNPDDELLSALLIKLFMDRQIMVSPEIITYILNNMRRSFAFARQLVEEIDNTSLAHKRAVSVPIVREALQVLNNTAQGELF